MILFWFWLWDPESGFSTPHQFVTVALHLKHNDWLVILLVREKIASKISNSFNKLNGCENIEFIRMGNVLY